jgi:hypothetical protein
MKQLIIDSKKYGTKIVLLDDEDYERIKNDFKSTKWCVTKNRNNLYAQKRADKKMIYLHRYIMNCPKEMYVDHVNHNTLDNRKCNLRITTNADNLRNGNIRKNNTTGINGVYYDKTRKKYVARIKVNYKNIMLGRYNTLEEATNIRKNAEIKFWQTKER